MVIRIPVPTCGQRLRIAWGRAVSVPRQIEIYRGWDNARKMRSMFEMFEFALRQVETGTRLRHPDWDDERVEAEVRRLVTGVEPVAE
jgi:hypothetical protein